MSLSPLSSAFFDEALSRCVTHDWIHTGRRTDAGTRDLGYVNYVDDATCARCGVEIRVEHRSQVEPPLDSGL